MVDRAELEAAAAAGVIAPEQVAPLHDFLATRTQPVQQRVSGEEDLRFIRNFHDVFLAIGIALLAIGLAIAIGTFTASHEGGEFSDYAVIASGGCVGAAVLMWALAEFFARRRRLFLPAIALCLAFVGFAGTAMSLIYGLAISELGQEVVWQNSNQGLAVMPWQLRTLIVASTAAAFVAAAAYYWRFRLPFSMGVTGSLGALFVGSVLFASAPQLVWDLRNLVMFVMGVSLFLFGIWFDSRDPERATRLSDNGFWLHVAAAPLILNGALALASAANIIGDYSSARLGTDGLQNSELEAIAGQRAVLQSIITLVIVFVLGLISLLINRRALIVSALVTTGIAIGMLMNASGLGAGALAAGTLVALGGFVLVIGASWHGMRRALLGWVKPGGALARIFPPEIPA